MSKKYKIIYDDILSKIKSRYYIEFQKLPTEHELTAMYGVSRITARRAMSELEKDMFVYRKQKSGTFVLSNAHLRNFIDSENTIPLVLQFDKHVGMEIMLGAQATASLNNRSLSFYSTQNSIKGERDTLSRLIDKKVSGIISCPCSSYENLDIFSQIKINKIPLVFIDRTVEGIDVPLVTTHNRRGMKDLANKLIIYGHKNIAFYPFSTRMSFPEFERFYGYCEALIENSIPVKNEYIYTNLSSFSPKVRAMPYHKQKESSEHEINSCLDHLLSLSVPPTAIMCVNDATARLLMIALQNRGLTIPDDISVTGFDNIMFNDLPVPITTMQQDFYNMGSITMETLFDLMENKPTEKISFLDSRAVITKSIKNLHLV